MPLFSRFKNKGAQSASKSRAQPSQTNGRPAVPPQRPRWVTTWNSKLVEPEEVAELIHACTAEMKSRADALNTPFFFLPFRPDSDASGARTFIGRFYKANAEGSQHYRGAGLQQELRLTEPIVLCSIIKWCWSRMPGGVVTWPVYEGFQIGENESHGDRNAFQTFVPIGADSSARRSIIFDFFDLIAAIAAHGKSNGLGGRKLSRLAGWWAFEHSDDGNGFEGGYRSWRAAADACSHMFFAYLRSLSPEDPSMSVIERIPRSLQALLASTEYPPETPQALQRSTPRVVMQVDSVSPTPFSLLRRAKHFEYRDRDRVLRAFSEYDDPLEALTYECKRVLYAISSINSSAALANKHGNIAKTGQESWSAFQNSGFAEIDARAPAQTVRNGTNGSSSPNAGALQGHSQSPVFINGRPTTPSWADFMSSGFSNEGGAKSSVLTLPSDKVLPPIGGSRTNTPMHGVEDDDLAPGELAAVTSVELDDAFWWVWMTSLAGEEHPERKAVFGRCALIETILMKGQWLIMEEQVKGASPEPAEGTYVAPKKGIFSFTKRGRSKRTRNEPANREPVNGAEFTPNKNRLAPDQHHKIRAAAAALNHTRRNSDVASVTRRGRFEDGISSKTNSMLTPGMVHDASPAMKWATAYDKSTVRAQYLGDSFAGIGMSRENLMKRTSSVNRIGDGSSSNGTYAPALSPAAQSFPTDSLLNRDLPAVPKGAESINDTKSSSPADHGSPESSPHLPGPLPTKAPTVNVMTVDADGVQQQADQRPFARANPPSDRVGRKPVPRMDKLQDHPAFRQHSMDEAAAARPQPTKGMPHTKSAGVRAAARALEGKSSPPSSPESQTSNFRFNKHGAPAGFKKFLGKSKGVSNRKSVDALRSGSVGLTPPAESQFARRLSLIRKKTGDAAPPHTNQVAAAQPASEVNHDSVTLPSHDQFVASADDALRSDNRSDINSDEEFQRFDQGPMQDMPGALPFESNEDLMAPAPLRQFNTQHVTRTAPKQQDTDHEDFMTPMEREDPTNDAQMSERTPKGPETIDPVQNRWAAIRENAAKRAAKGSEEQSMPSRPSQSQSVREMTDDGETSGEETIESRVARIKARVAQLTGQPEPAGEQI